MKPTGKEVLSMKKGKRGVIRLELLTAILCLISQLVGLLITVIDKFID